MKFEYEKCTTWLRKKAAELTALGLKVEAKENSTPMQSFLLKIASARNDAELVVWETGATSMIVVNISTNNYDLDRHNLVLTGEQFESDLDVFFELLK